MLNYVFFKIRKNVLDQWKYVYWTVIVETLIYLVSYMFSNRSSNVSLLANKVAIANVSRLAKANLQSFFLNHVIILGLNIKTYQTSDEITRIKSDFKKNTVCIRSTKWD